MEFRILVAAIVVAALAAAVFFLGPRVSTNTTVRFDPSALGDDPEAYLAASEAKPPDIREGLEKEIIWADPSRREKTPLSIVYIHGFSASKGELRPLPDHVAAALGANLFYTRLSGHGRASSAMAETSVNAWVNDMAEALAIGRAIGGRVIVMATSTGGSLVTWAAAHPDAMPSMMRDVAGIVLVSPNYGVRAGGAWILTMPWGGAIARIVLGPERGFEPVNDMHARYWTTRYPTEALLPMAALVKLARRSAVDRINVPALFVYSPEDEVVRPERIAAIAERWGAPHDTVIVEDAGDPSNHVLAGEALSPDNTDRLTRQMVDWIRSVVS